MPHLRREVKEEKVNIKRRFRLYFVKNLERKKVKLSIYSDFFCRCRIISEVVLPSLFVFFFWLDFGVNIIF